MRTLALLSACATFLVLLSAAICGAWMQAGGASVADSIGFHTACGASALALSALTILLSAVALRRSRGGKGRKSEAKA